MLIFVFLHSCLPLAAVLLCQDGLLPSEIISQSKLSFLSVALVVASYHSNIKVTDTVGVCVCVCKCTRYVHIHVCIRAQLCPSTYVHLCVCMRNPEVSLMCQSLCYVHFFFFDIESPGCLDSPSMVGWLASYL